MDNFNQLVEWIRSQPIDDATLAIHFLVFVINLILLFFSHPFLAIFNKGKDISVQARILRAGAFVFLILHIIDLLLYSTFPAYEHYFVKIGLSLATVFGCLILFNVTSYLTRQKFGYQKTIDDKVVYLDSYNSRLLDLLAGVFAIFVAVYCIVNVWGWSGLLQTTGLLGIIFGLMALTSNVWFPDVYYGLVILNSNMLEDGDVIKLTGFDDEQIISRVSFVYTILLDLRNNHRVLIRNSRLVQNGIDNLSKRASTDGLRHSMNFNIGFPPPVPLAQSKLSGEAAGENNSERVDDNSDSKPTSPGYDAYRRAIKRVFDRAHQVVVASEEAKINRNLPFELALTNTGDYALSFRLSYYLESLPNTKVTKTMRQYLVRTPSIIQEAVNAAAVAEGVVLATPMLINHRDVAVRETEMLPTFGEEADQR